MKATITVATVAALLGVSTKRVQQLDDALQPRRGDLGVRFYDQDRVDAELGRRIARRAGR